MYNPLTMSEYFKVFGLMMPLSCFDSIQRHEWFYSDPIYIRKGAPYQLNHYILNQTMNLILALVSYTDNLFLIKVNDCFFLIWQFVRELSLHMMTTFLCSWILFLGGSMIVWLNNYNCTGWMVFPQNLHLFGNEWHTILCDLCGIILHRDLVEGGVSATTAVSANI